MPYETQYICDECEHTFYRITDNDPRKKGGRPPSCPQCKKAEAQDKGRIKVSGDFKPQTEEQKVENINKIIESRKAPTLHGKNPYNKAWDDTQKMVAEDYKMTDLNVGNLREGDNMVAKLRPDLEQRVGQGWNAKQKNNVAGLAGANLNTAITSAINSNRFAKQGDVVSRAMSVVERPVTNFVGEYRPEKSS